MIANAELGHFLQITIARETLPFLKKSYTISPGRKLQNRATFCKLRSQEKLYHFSRKTIHILLIANCRIGPLSANYDRKKNWTISQEKTIQFLLIANYRIGPLSANYDRKKKPRPFLKKNYTISPDRKLQNRATFCKLRSQEKLYNFSWSRIAEMGHFLQITIARKTLTFLKKNYTYSPDRKLQNTATFYKLRSQEKLYHFSRKTIHILLIANCRIRPLSANYDRKKNFTISQEKQYNFSWPRIAEMGHFLQITIERETLPFLKKNNIISPDRELQKWVTFCKLRSKEELDHFSRKTIQFLLIANCRNGPLSANYDCKKNFTISQEKLYIFSWSQIPE